MSFTIEDIGTAIIVSPGVVLPALEGEPGTKGIDLVLTAGKGGEWHGAGAECVGGLGGDVHIKPGLGGNGFEEPNSGGTVYIYGTSGEVIASFGEGGIKFFAPVQIAEHSLLLRTLICPEIIASGGVAKALKIGETGTNEIKIGAAGVDVDIEGI